MSTPYPSPFKTVFLQAAESSGSEGGGYSQLLIFALMIGVLYFFMIRPQQRRRKEQKQFISGIKAGDYAVTAGGIHGKISSVEDQIVVLEVDEGTRIKVDKDSISREASLTHQAAPTSSGDNKN
ncbi:MAG: preprotein translocase subunit YajC [Cytophagales bacterium]|nr:preprotein translocase subunit YajC [Cytophagales bacterium]